MDPQRLREVRRSIKSKRIEAFLVTEIHNVRYLSGFSGSSGFLFITAKRAYFVTDFRYKEQSEREVKGWEIVIVSGRTPDVVRKLAKEKDVSRLGFEDSLAYHSFQELGRTGLKLLPTSGVIEELREKKNASELVLIKEAIRRAETAFTEIRPHIRNGSRETEIALRLEEKIRKKGARNVPFEIIVASGANSAMPHAHPTEKRLQAGDFVIVDWGAEADGYYSDMTRTLLLAGGSDTGKKKEIYKTVLTANRKSISETAPGKKSKDIDAAGRDYIRRKGYGDFFGHGTGHGVGLQVHESPRISWNQEGAVKEGVVFTIEPGIYVPGLGGVRIEDMVRVGKKKAEVLTSLEKDLEIV